MPKGSNQKLKLYYLSRIFVEKTDENHMLNMAEIKEELLKSCELTGIWEKKLRDIEHKTYDPAQFINELKQQITDIVNQVLTDNTNRRITLMPEEEKKKRKPSRQ